MIFIPTLDTYARTRTRATMKPPDESFAPKGNPSNVTPRLMAHIAASYPPERIQAELDKLFSAKLHNNQPDVRAIEAGLKLVLAYTVGLPVQRQEVTETRVNVSLDPEKLLSNPATLEAIARKLRGTEAGERLLGALASQPRQVTGDLVPEA